MKIDFEKFMSWYLFDTEFLVEAHKKRLGIIEVPVSTFYDEDSGSSAPPLKYGIQSLLFSLKYRFRHKKS